MLDAWNRVEHYPDLAEECRRLAASTFSGQMKNRYLLMAKDFALLADIEKQERACHTKPRSHKMQLISERPA
jgi:hypothetical protein